MRRRQTQVAVEAAQRTRRNEAPARGDADEAGRGAGPRPTAWRLVDIEIAEKVPRSAIASTATSCGGPATGRSLSAAHQSDRERSRAAVAILYAARCGRRGVQEPEGRPGDTAGLPSEEERIEAHIFIAFLAYCLQVTLQRRLHALAPGLTARSAIEKFAAVQMIDVHLPTTDGRELLLTRYTQPEPELRLLIQQLKLQFPPQPPPRYHRPHHP